MEGLGDFIDEGKKYVHYLKKKNIVVSNVENLHGASVCVRWTKGTQHKERHKPVRRTIIIDTRCW